MENIVSQLTSLEWWFTVVLVGIFVSVIGAYARDWFGKLASSFSKRMGVYVQKARDRERTIVEKLVSSQALLQIEYTRAVIYLISAVATMGFSFLLPAWSTLTRHYPDADMLFRIFGSIKLDWRIELFINFILFVEAMILLNRFLIIFTRCEVAKERFQRKT